MPVNIIFNVNGFKFWGTNMENGAMFPWLEDELTKRAVKAGDYIFWETFHSVVNNYSQYYEAMQTLEALGTVQLSPDYLYTNCLPDNYYADILVKGLDNPQLSEEVKGEIKAALSGKYKQELPIEHKKKTKEGWIYVLQSPRNEFKIGLTTQKPSSRLEQISPQLPYKVELILTVASTDVVSDEAYLHDRYTLKRLNGEWFTLSEEDLEYIGSAEWQLK